MKKVVSILLTTILIMSLLFTTYAMENVGADTLVLNPDLVLNDDTKTALVSTYFSAINDNDYIEIVNMTPSVFRNMMAAIYSNEINQSNNIGLFNISSITAECIRWDMEQILHDYLNIHDLENYTNYEVALVETTIECNVDDEGFADGKNYLCVSLVEEAGEYYVYDMVVVEPLFAAAIMADVSLATMDAPRHAIMFYSRIEDGHMFRCEWCENLQTDPHEFYVDTNSTTHTLLCQICDYVIHGEHVYSGSSMYCQICNYRR